MSKIVISDVEITHLKHAGFKIRNANLVIYFDPFKIINEKADLIFISHDHFDHFDPETIATLSTASTKILGPKILNTKVKANFIPLLPGQSVTEDGVKIETIPAYNLERDHHPKGNGYLGYVITLNDLRLYHAGDTDKTPEMENLNKIDVAMLPIGGVFAMDEIEAAEAVKTFRPKTAIPMHYADEIIPSGDGEKFKRLVGESSRVEII